MRRASARLQSTEGATATSAGTLDDDLRFLAGVHPGNFYMVHTTDRQANKQSLFQVSKVVYPPGWEEASRKKKATLFGRIRVRGVWFYRWNETADSVRRAPPKKVDREEVEEERDKDDDRKFLGPPTKHVKVNKLQVYRCRNAFGHYAANVKVAALGRKVNVVYGQLPLSCGSRRTTLHYNKTYHECFMTYEDFTPSDGPTALPQPPATATRSQRRSGRHRRYGSTRRKVHRHRRESTATHGITADEPLPRHLRGPLEPIEPDDTRSECVHVAPFFSATGALPSPDLLAQLLPMVKDHRAPHPATRDCGKEGEVLCGLDLCCGAGGSAAPVSRSVVEDVRQQLLATMQVQGGCGDAGGSWAGTGGPGVIGGYRCSSGGTGGAGDGVRSCAANGELRDGSAPAGSLNVEASAGGCDSVAGGEGGGFGDADFGTNAAAGTTPAVAVVAYPSHHSSLQQDNGSCDGDHPEQQQPKQQQQPQPQPLQQPQPFAAEVRTLWGCDINMAALLSYMANHEKCALLLCCRVEELWALIYLANELWAWLLEMVDESDDEGDGEDEEGKAEGVRQGQDGAEPFPDVTGTGRKPSAGAGTTAARVNVGAHAEGREDKAAAQEDLLWHEDMDGEDATGGRTWEVKDIWAMCLRHRVPMEQDNVTKRCGQLKRELDLAADCQLEFLVEWAYDEEEDRKFWSNYPVGRLQWVPLSELNCFVLLRKFMRRLLVEENVLPRRGLKLRLVAGCPCQDLTRHNRGIHLRTIFDSVKNRIVLTVLHIARYLQVEYLLLEQVTDAAQMQDGLWLRTVQAKLNEMGYQHRTLVVHASGHGVPQIRPRLFLVAARSGNPLPPCPRPEFCRTLELPLRPDRLSASRGLQDVRKRLKASEAKKVAEAEAAAVTTAGERNQSMSSRGRPKQTLRRRIRSLRRCFPTAGLGAALYPGQTLLDAASNLEERDSFSMSPVTRVTQLEFPLQHVLAQPPPEGTLPPELRFAFYLGNSAPAVLALARAVLHRFHWERRDAEARVRQRVVRRLSKAKREAAAAGGAAGPGAAPAGSVDTATAMKELVKRELIEEVYLRMGLAIAQLQHHGKRKDKDEHKAAAAPAAARRCGPARLSYVTVGRRVVGCAAEALQRSMEQAPECLRVLRRELARLEVGSPGPREEGGEDGAAAGGTGGAAAQQAEVLDGDAATGDRAAGGNARRHPAASSRNTAAVAPGALRQSSGPAAGTSEPPQPPAAVAAAPRLPILVANHLPFPLPLDEYERVQAVPRRPGAGWRDMQGAPGGLLPCGAPLFPAGLLAHVHRQVNPAGAAATKRAKLNDGSASAQPAAAAPDLPQPRPRPAATARGPFHQPYGRLHPLQAFGTVCGSSLMTAPRRGSLLHWRQHRLLTPREWACIQGYSLHMVFLSTESPLESRLRYHTGLVSRTEALLKPAIRGLEWLLRVGPAALAGTDQLPTAEEKRGGGGGGGGGGLPRHQQGDGLDGLHPAKLNAAWHMLRRVVKDACNQVGNSWAPPVARAHGRCLALALLGAVPRCGQARVPDPAWGAAWQWATAAAAPGERPPGVEGGGGEVRCAQALLQGRWGLWEVGPEEEDKTQVNSEEFDEESEREWEEEEEEAWLLGTEADAGEEEQSDEDEDEVAGRAG